MINNEFTQKHLYLNEISDEDCFATPFPPPCFATHSQQAGSWCEVFPAVWHCKACTDSTSGQGEKWTSYPMGYVHIEERMKSTKVDAFRKHITEIYWKKEIKISLDSGSRPTTPSSTDKTERGIPMRDCHTYCKITVQMVTKIKDLGATPAG